MTDVTAQSGAGSLAVTGRAPLVVAANVSSVNIGTFAPGRAVSGLRRVGLGSSSLFSGRLASSGLRRFPGGLSTLSRPRPTSGLGVISHSVTPPGSVDQDIAAGTGSLVVSGLAPIFTSGRTVAAAEGTLAVDGRQPQVAHGARIQGGAGQYEIAGHAPSVLLGQPVVVNAGAGSVLLTGRQPEVNAGISATVIAGVGAYETTGHQPGIIADLNGLAEAGAGSLSITGAAPVIAQGHTLIPGTGGLEVTGYAPLVSAGGAEDYLLVNDTGDYRLINDSGDRHIISDDASVAISAGAGAYGIAGQQPSVNADLNALVQAGTGAIEFTGLAPVVSSGYTVDAGVGALEVTGVAPSIAHGIATSSGVGALEVTGYAPTVDTASGASEFKFKVQTDNTGGSADDQFTIQLNAGWQGGSYDFHVEWGDGDEEDNTANSDLTHTYPSAGEYTITITGTINGVAWDNDGGDIRKITEILEWGPLALTFNSSFGGGTAGNPSSFDVSASDDISFDGSSGATSSAFKDNDAITNIGAAPTIPAGSSFSLAFHDSPLFNDPNVGSWGVSGVIRFDYMFYCTGAGGSFDQDISSWDFSGINNAQGLDGFMNGQTLSTANYDALLIALNANKTSYRNDLAPHFGNSVYTSGGAAEAARDDLVAYGWTISDNGGT